ncbi:MULTISPECIES: lytic transglycosylase F [Desulfosediminicola]|uniref:transglycosylase SLT domain-containing protein n=1 Tax=Desulfosediminicola TaxID=2886823 RepID=UPI0010ABE182|nr:lytic transglycosylase F [Desulfosediminicola ganghwensis]
MCNHSLLNRAYQFISILLTAITATMLIHPACTIAAFPNEIDHEAILQKNIPFTGDFDKILERRLIRVLIPYSKTYFFYDGAEPRGLSYDSAKKFEAYVNSKLNNPSLSIWLVVVPTARKDLLTKLNEGFGDIIMGNLTITENRLEQVDFSDPFMTDVNEILITPKSYKTLHSVEEIAGIEIYVRESSSYYENLLKLNEQFKEKGIEQINLTIANENFEDEDLLEMVNANMIPAIVMDDHKADFWNEIFDNIRLHPDVKVGTEGNIAWGIRKNNPELKKIIDEFLATHKRGTLWGNIQFDRYLKDTSYITDATHADNLTKFMTVEPFFEKYGTKYDFDPLLLTALAYQESRLDQNAISLKGAVGIMQILPSTAKSQEVAIGNINTLENNIHAGTKYLRFLADRYFSESENMDQFDRWLMCLAAYNAGPAKIIQLQKEAENEGLNPNIWFDNVEIIASRRIGRETVRYVQNILKYYVAYKMLTDKIKRKRGLTDVK